MYELQREIDEIREGFARLHQKQKAFEELVRQQEERVIEERKNARLPIEDIVARRKALIEQQAVIAEELVRLQTICPHPINFQTIRSRGDTGNYDPSADRYWTEHRCEICGKFWTKEE
jgi:uncharacterized protein YicC (UPF0701 family)